MVTETCTEKVKRVTADGDREPFIEKLKCIIERADGIDIFYSEPPKFGGADIQCFVMFQGLRAAREPGADGDDSQRRCVAQVHR